MTFIPSQKLQFLNRSNVDPCSFLFAFSGKETFLKRTPDSSETPAGIPAKTSEEALIGRFPLFNEFGNLLPATSETSDAPLLHIGELNGRSCVATQLDPVAELPETFFSVPSRRVLAAFPSDFCTAFCRARILLFWQKNHRFCGKCGSPTSTFPDAPALQCVSCGNLYFPQIAPAVIVLVSRNDEILLAHNRQFTNGMFGLIAGFVEAGESAEEAVRRELREEVGIEIQCLEYRKSQSWPFPNSLMLGFRAEYLSGEARADGVELDEARWFTANNLPQIPPPGSIARTLLDEWFVERKKGE